MTTSQQVYAAILAAHAPPEWACFSEVGNSTGSGCSRHADAVAVNLWPSRGYEIRGFEIKVSRGDLKRELTNPAKAEAIAKHCNSWWLATPKGLVAQPDTLPLGWGLYEVDEAGKIRIARPAVPRTEVPAPRIGFVAAIIRASQKELDSIRTRWVKPEDIAEQLAAEYQRGLARAPDENKYRAQALERKIADARPVLAVLGIDIDANSWNQESIGKEAAADLALGRALRQKFGAGLPLALRQIDGALERLREVRKALDELSGAA
jgi:hypothetical protein